MKTFYFPIQSTSLAHYFGSAIIKPARYFNNKPSDIQDRFESFLLFTNKFGTKETDCCLEIVLTDDEIKDLINVNDGWFLFDEKPLPISRIKRIIFSDKEKRNITISNIRMSTAYVPETLVKEGDFDENSSKTIQIPSDCKGINQEKKLIKYDRFLGALALMKTAGEPYMNYSPNYISTLAFFNSKIQEQLNKICNHIFRDSYQGIFTQTKGFEKVLPYLDQLINEQALYNCASDEKQEIRKDKITHIIDIDSINENTWTYIIAILNTYGVGDEARKKKIDRLIYTHFSEIGRKAEGAALCYGYNRGYSAFTKDYGINEKVSFKYKLETQLDYYTIESVYQYVFNEVVSYSFPYLDEWCPKHSICQPKRKTDYVILDEVIIGKKKAKVFSEEWWNSLSPIFDKTFAYLSHNIFHFFQKLCEEIQEDIEAEKAEEKEELIAIYQRKLDEKTNLIDELTEKLNQNNKEKKDAQQFGNKTEVKDRFIEKRRTELQNMLKQKLYNAAKTRGIHVSQKTKKDDIIELILIQEFKHSDLFS